MSDQYGAKPSAYPLVISPLSIEDLHFYYDRSPYLEAHTTFSKRDSRYIRQGWRKEAFSVIIPL